MVIINIVFRIKCICLQELCISIRSHYYTSYQNLCDLIKYVGMFSFKHARKIIKKMFEKLLFLFLKIKQNNIYTTFIRLKSICNSFELRFWQCFIELQSESFYFEIKRLLFDIRISLFWLHNVFKFSRVK